MVRVKHEKLRTFVGGVFRALHVPPEDADIAAAVLVAADLRGVDSHGVVRVNPRSFYIKDLSDGRINPSPRIEVVRENASSQVVDGDGGLGMVVGHRAMEMAIEKARDSGVGFVAVRNSRHFGMSAYYSMMALSQDLIGIAMTNASRQVVPTFGRESRYGTNPISLAAPADKEEPFVLDMATTTAAAGKLEIAARHGKSIPVGWALDEDANDTTDPRAAQKARMLLPLGSTRDGGSHKGYGLAIMVEILCGVLSGSVAMRNGAKSPDRGHFFGAIDIGAFRPVEEFKASMDRMLDELRNTPPQQGEEQVYVAGDIELSTARDRTANGIPLHPSIVDDLQALGKEYGVPYDL
jgi:LDH2 family malate/lactate/ureidoglycolate dehydrogenase